MAAETKDYFQIEASFRGSNNVTMIVNPAKAQQFGSGLTDLTALTNFIKQTFYLDDLIPFKANYLGTEYHGFWGTCIEGGFNESMHKSTRIIELHGDTLAQKKRTFNDSGLNTKGFSEPKSIVSSVFTDVRVSVLFKSSYMDNTTAYGFIYRYRLADSSGWGPWSSDMNLQPVNGPINAKTEQTQTVSIPTSGSATRWVEMKSYIDNPEGRFDLGSLIIVPTLVSVLLESAIAWTNHPTTFYIDTPTIETVINGGQTGLYAFNDLTGRYNTPLTLWEDSRYYYRYGYDLESNKYLFIEKIDSLAPPAYNTFNFAGYSESSQSQANDQVINNTGAKGTIYQNPGTSRWYRNSALTTIADDGYYASGDISGVTGELYLINGYNQY